MFIDVCQRPTQIVVAVFQVYYTAEKLSYTISPYEINWMNVRVLLRRAR